MHHICDKKHKSQRNAAINVIRHLGVVNDCEIIYSSIILAFFFVVFSDEHHDGLRRATNVIVVI
jgi:hypothetical protein